MTREAVQELLLVRHGESEGNVAAAAAERAGEHTVDIAERDADVVLSPLGRRQAEALGRWLAGLSADDRPDAVVSSPYRRTRQTAGIALDTAHLDLPVRLDERLRDRELGILDRLTRAGVEARHPDEAARRRHQGTFYYRPPGGESWADVALRLRSVLPGITGRTDARRVLVTCHDAVILLVRYVLEDLTEDELLVLARSGSVPNAGVTHLVRETPTDERWRAVTANDVGHLADVDVPPTEHPGVVGAQG